MKKKLIGLLIGVMVLFPSIVLAEENDVTLIGGEEVTDYAGDDTYFASGDEFSSDKVLYHNYFIAGNTVNSNDYVSGILFAAGNNVNLLGISDYAFVAGNVLSIEGINYNDMFLAGNEITIKEGSQVSRDVYAAGSKIVINTTVEGNAYVAAEVLDLSDAVVMGNLNVYAGTILLNDNTQILGSIYYNSNATVTKDLSKVASSVNAYEVDTDNEKEESVSDIAISEITSYLALLVVGLVIMVLAPKVYDKLNTKTNAGEYLAKLGKGLLTLIALPICAIILLFTGIGAPLAIISILLYGIMIYLSYAACGLAFGKTLFNKLKVKTNKYLEFAAGLLIVKILMLIPYLGSLIEFIFLTIGLWLIIEYFIPSKK